jgi:leucyl-tRNA synthetase
VIDSRKEYGHGQGVEMQTLHRTIERVSRGLEDLRYHTAIAALMEMSNWIGAVRQEMTAEQLHTSLEHLTLLLAPIAPYTAEELWSRLGREYSVHTQSWPTFDPAALVESTVTLVVQVNSKLRERLELPSGVSQEAATERAMQSERVAAALAGKTIRKTVWVPDKLLNLVAG